MNESLTVEERRRAAERVWKKLLAPPTKEELEKAKKYLADHDGQPPEMGTWLSPEQRENLDK